VAPVHEPMNKAGVLRALMRSLLANAAILFIVFSQLFLWGVVFGKKIFLFFDFVLRWSQLFLKVILISKHENSF
jgi:hypothetical protein